MVLAMSHTNIDYSHYNTDTIGKCSGQLWQGVDENGNAIDDDNIDDDNIDEDNIDEENNNPYGLINIIRHPIPPRPPIPNEMFYNNRHIFN